MLAKVDPWTMKIVSVLLAVGLYMLAQHYPDAANDLKVLAGYVLGWLSIARPGDARVVGVHVDDLPDSRS